MKITPFYLMTIAAVTVAYGQAVTKSIEPSIDTAMELLSRGEPFGYRQLNLASRSANDGLTDTFGGLAVGIAELESRSIESIRVGIDRFQGQVISKVINF